MLPQRLTLTRDAKQIPWEQHLEQYKRIQYRPPVVGTVPVTNPITYKLEIHLLVSFSEQVVIGD